MNKEQGNPEKVARCPKCGSISIFPLKQGYDDKKGLTCCCLFGLPGLICGLSGANKVKMHCANCDNQW